MTDWRSRAGRVVMIGVPAVEIGRADAERVRALAPGGVILFARNLETPRQTVELLAALRRLLPSPTLLALDQEGGRVNRLETWIGPTPTAVSFSLAGAASTERFGRVTATGLRALGFNLDFAPVVDLCAENATNGIGNRSFGDDPVSVTRLAGAFLRGLQHAGVAGCLKHFPGLGDTVVDSHVELPTASRSRAELSARDLVPFRRLGGDAASVMVGHAHYPAIDGPAPRPASGSVNLVSGVLRGELGFGGLVVSDDLEMGAVSSLDASGSFALQAVSAGCDLLLYCHTLERAAAAVASLAAEAAHSPAFGRRLQEAATRVERTAGRWSAPAADLTSWASASARFAEFADLA